MQIQTRVGALFGSMNKLSAATLVALTFAGLSACGDDDSEKDPDPPPFEMDGAVADAGDAAIDAEPYDPYWSGHDAKVDIIPDAEPPARPYHWTDWTTAKKGEDGSAQGVISLGGDASVSVSYAGQLHENVLDDGIVYWIPDAPYRSAAIANAPATPDMLRLSGGEERVHQLTFSAPIENPVIALMSFGSPKTTAVSRYDTHFELLSFGEGYWKGGQPLKHLPDNTLSGRESYGVIRFPGTHSSIRWTSKLAEPWHGITVGVAGH